MNVVHYKIVISGVSLKENGRRMRRRTPRIATVDARACGGSAVMPGMTPDELGRGWAAARPRRAEFRDGCRRRVQVYAGVRKTG